MNSLQQYEILYAETISVLLHEICGISEEFKKRLIEFD